jgi:hypothetical protein
MPITLDCNANYTTSVGAMEKHLFREARMQQRRGEHGETVVKMQENYHSKKRFFHHSEQNYRGGKCFPGPNL